MGIISKVKKAAKNYAKNVAGGAGIVAGAISSAAKKVGGKSQTANVYQGDPFASISKNPSNYQVNPDGTSKPSTAKPQTPFQLIKGAVAPKGSVSSFNPILGGGNIGNSISNGGNLLNSSVAKQVTSGGFRSSGGSSGGNAMSSISADGTSLANNRSFGSSSFSSPAGQTGLGSNVSSVPASSVVNSQLKPVVPITLPTPTISESPTIAPVADPYADLKAQEKTTQDDYLKGLLDDFQNKETGAEIENKLRKQLQIEQKQQEVSSLSGKLNGIVAQGEANKLSLVGQGRGIPEAIIGGQQAQIARETAIQALPVQAQLEAAQGNLEMANDSLDRLFKIYSDDADNEFAYKQSVRKAVYDFATTSQKRDLEKLDKMEERAYTEKQAIVKEGRALAGKAFEFGQSSLGSKIMALNPNSPTYQQELSQLTSQLKDPVQVAQLQKLNMEIREMNAQSEARAAGGANEDLTAYASQYADTGKLPSPAELKLSGLSVGQVTTMAKQIPRGKGFVVSNTTGTKSNSVSAEAEKDFQKLYNITEMTKRLKELDEKRIGGVVAGTLGKVFGSEAQGEYLTLRKAIVDEMSRMQSGAALTPDEIAVYNDYLPGRLSESFGFGQDSYKKISNFETAMNQKLENRLSNNGLSVYGYSKVPVGGVMRTVGEVIDVGGVNYRVLPDGNLTDIL